MNLPIPSQILQPYDTIKSIYHALLLTRVLLLSRVIGTNAAGAIIAFWPYRQASFQWVLHSSGFNLVLRPSSTRQLVASNICGYFDLVSNMLPRIESCSISGNMLLGC